MKKVFRLFLVIFICLCFAPITDIGIKANATSKSQNEAISWVQSQVGKSIDTDGFPSGQPYQCVDLIKAYYSYLGVSPVSGNGSDYSWNSLPAGWQRIKGAQPQKGDILVYTGGYNNYGHVAIYESDRVHYHQNFDNCYYVKRITYRYNGLSTPYWGVIRPNWSSQTSYFTSLWHGEVGETNARIDATINLTYIQQCGFYYGTSTSNMERVVENTYANTINIWFNLNEYGITLLPGTTYYYKIFIVVNGIEYQTDTKYFTTVHRHYYNSCVTINPTCAKDGVRTYQCLCGASYTEAIKATGNHTYSNACDKECNVCKENRKISAHKYNDNCDSTCNICGTKRFVKHIYSNSCDRECNVCKSIRSITHSYQTTIIKATLINNGKAVTKCTACGYVSKTVQINYPKTIKLSATTYTYNGKTKTPSVTVKDSSGKTLKKGTDYTVTYPKKRKSIGKYTVTVTFKGNYSGTKKLTFEIVPKKITLSKLTAGKKQLTAAWKTVSGVTGYEVTYSTSKKFTKKTTKTVTIKNAKTTKTTIKKLKKGKKYYVKVRAYKTVSGKKIYGAYSSVKSVKVK